MNIWQDRFLQFTVAIFFAGAVSLSGVANAAVFLLFLFSLFYIGRKKNNEQKIYVGIFALPLVVALLQMAMGYPVMVKALDAPSRFFLAAVGVFSLPWLRTHVMVRAIAWVVLSALGVAVWAYLSTHVQMFFWGDGSRAWNGFSNPIPFGVLSVMTIFLVTLLPNDVLSKNKSQIWFIKGGAILCAAYAVYMTQTRSAILVVPFLLILVSVYYSRGSWRHSFFCLMPIMALALFVACTDNNIKNRINEGVNDFAIFDKNINTSMGLRVEMWRTAGLIFLDHPFFGVGKAGYYSTLQKMVKQGEASPYINGAPHPHNEFLNMGVETGLVGFFAGLLLYLFPLWVFWQNLRKKDRMLCFAGASGCVVVLTFLIAGTMDVYFWIVSQTAIYGMAVTVFYSLILARRRELASGGV